MRPNSLLDDDVFIALDVSFDDDHRVSPPGEHDCREAQDCDLSLVGQRHLVDFATSINSSPTAMETSFTGLYNSETNCSRSGTTLKTHRLHYAYESSNYEPMEPSTAIECIGIPAEHPEALTDVDFVDKLEGRSTLPAQDFQTVERGGSAEICRLFEAPIITFHSEGTITGMSSADKENSLLPYSHAARRNIFGAAQQPSARHMPTLIESPTDPISGRRMTLSRRFEANGSGGREDRKLRKTSSLSEQQLLMFQRRGATLSKRHSETEATAEARRLDLMVAECLDFDDGRRANLVGDFSRPCCLPLVEGAKHQDLKTISCQTMARILNNEFDGVVGRCIIVDCRYPYEFQGGHITGAKNYYRKDDIINEFIISDLHDSSTENQLTQHKRTIIVFHCEFSSERGPKLLRFLRNKDRDLHADCYPKLRHPELYLLEGGYREFHGEFADLCAPVGGYIPMVDRKYVEQLAFYRQASKLYSGSSERKTSATARSRYCRI